jgi:hypothetical protein
MTYLRRPSDRCGAVLSIFHGGAPSQAKHELTVVVYVSEGQTTSNQNADLQEIFSDNRKAFRGSRKVQPQSDLSR